MLCSCPPLKDIVLLLVISVVHPGWPPPHPQPPAGPGGGAQKDIRSFVTALLQLLGTSPSFGL
jgi:hypothetical protein